MSHKFFGILFVGLVGFGLYILASSRGWVQFLSSSAVSPPEVSTMDANQLQSYILTQQKLLGDAQNNMTQYYTNIFRGYASLDALSSPRSICENGMSNYPDCNDALCQKGYRLQGGICVSDCEVQYMYTKNISLNKASTSGNIDTDIDLIFTNKDLEEQYRSSAQTVRFFYDRAQRVVRGEFDTLDGTQVCKPFMMSSFENIFETMTCDQKSQESESCTLPGRFYTAEILCSVDQDTYVLKRCSQDLILTGSVSQTTSSVGQSVAFSVVATGGTGTYTYVWSGTDALSGKDASVSKTYTSIGLKTATVTVTSGDKTKTLSFTHTVKTAPLSVIIRPTSMNPTLGSTVGLYAVVSGGVPPYRYTWSGTESLTGTAIQTSKIYKTVGNKVVMLTVQSADGQKQTTTINIASLNPIKTVSAGVLDISCTPSSRSAKIGQNISWTATAKGGTGIYSYTWSFLSGTSKETRIGNPVYTVYQTAGTKTASVTVTSGTQTKTVSCPTTIIQ